jgi:hypothetical protein
VIESFVEGRVRLRSSLLADPAFAERLKEELLKISGVCKVEINPRTRGLLLEYDKKRLPLPLLMCAAPLFSRIDEWETLAPDQRQSALEKFMEDLRHLVFSNIAEYLLLL